MQAFRTRIAQSSQSAFWRLQDNAIGRIIGRGDEARYVEVTQAANDPACWQVAVYAGNSAAEPAVTAVLRRIFSLDADLSAFYDHCGQHPVLAGAISRWWGARLLRDADPFACALSTIISQQINLKFASELKRRLWALAGTPVLVDGGTYYADPPPEAIARLDYEELQELQFTRRKAEYIIDFARAVVAGGFDLAALANLDDETAMAQLCSLRGFGPWTAECILLFGLGRPDLLPAKDVGLRRAVTASLGLEERISEPELRDMAEAWRPWRSWATYYLWLDGGAM